jgi:hypothetical protein
VLGSSTKLYVLFRKGDIPRAAISGEGVIAIGIAGVFAWVPSLLARRIEV